jgi:hypothetical protein
MIDIFSFFFFHALIVCFVFFFQVKRQIWTQFPKLLRDLILPLFDKFCNEHDSIVVDIDVHNNMVPATLLSRTQPLHSGAPALIGPTTSLSSMLHTQLSSSSSSSAAAPHLLQRQQSIQAQTAQHASVLDELVQIIGQSVGVYNIILQYIRSGYVKKKSCAFGALRWQLVMALQEAQAQLVYPQDPVHAFAWCLTACIRKHDASLPRVSELYQTIAACPLNSGLLGDLSLVLSDRLAYVTLLDSCVLVIRECATKRMLPRDSEHLRLLLFLMRFSTLAFEMMDSKNYTYHIDNNAIISSCVTQMVLHCLDDLNFNPNEPTDLAVDSISKVSPDFVQSIKV